MAQLGNTNGFKKGVKNPATELTVSGRIAISKGKKNTQACIEAIATRTTFVSLDGDIFRPFGKTPITDMSNAKEIRCYGKEFSLYQEERLLKNTTANNMKKVVWISEEEFDSQYYVPHNMLDRAKKDGINI